MTNSNSKLFKMFVLAALVLSTTACSKISEMVGLRRFSQPSELECMERVVYFESNRSSRDGLIAVGSVVMNRVASPQFPNTVCGVVGQKSQFAPGVLTKDMKHSGLPLAKEAALAVMRGERHPLIGNAMFFHQAGMSFPYDNIHYVVVTGGNAFYEKRKSNLVTQPVPPAATEGLTGN